MKLREWWQLKMIQSLRCRQQLLLDQRKKSCGYGDWLIAENKVNGVRGWRLWVSLWSLMLEPIEESTKGQQTQGNDKGNYWLDNAIW